MKKTVEFEVLSLDSSLVFMATSYNRDGMYLITDQLNNASFVQVINNMVFGSCLQAGTYPETKDVETELIVEKESVNNDAISGDTLLKALAIAQNPELAKDLIK